MDLSSFAGRQIRLQLEVQGDSWEPSFAYWAQPIVTVGNPAQPPTFPPASGTPSRLLGSVERRGERYNVRLFPGVRGVLDSTIGFLNGSHSVYMRGFRVSVLGDALQDSRSACELLQAREEPAQNRYRVRHRFRSQEGDFDLLAELWIESGALRTRFWMEHAPAPRPWLN